MNQPARIRGIREYGDRALLLECTSVDEVLWFTEAIRSAAVQGVTDIIPGARTVVVCVADPRDTPRVLGELADIDVATTPGTADAGPADMVIDVVYDGPDLDEVARLTGMTADEVISAHTATPWRVAFGGFAPGFAYLTGGDRRLTVPRRAEPRARVPAGAVGLAGEFSGIYPRRSPGGWQLIGSTPAVLWDSSRTRPALLSPGMRVRFRAVRGQSR